MVVNRIGSSPSCASIRLIVEKDNKMITKILFYFGPMGNRIYVFRGNYYKKFAYTENRFHKLINTIRPKTSWHAELQDCIGYEGTFLRLERK